MEQAIQFNALTCRYGGSLQKAREPWFAVGLAGGQEMPSTQWSHRSDRHTIQNKFYTKPVTNPLKILKRSAMPDEMKVATFSNEMKRRLKPAALW